MQPPVKEPGPTVGMAFRVAVEVQGAIPAPGVRWRRMWPVANGRGNSGTRGQVAAHVACGQRWKSRRSKPRLLNTALQAGPRGDHGGKQRTGNPMCRGDRLGLRAFRGLLSGRPIAARLMMVTRRRLTDDPL